MAKTYDLPARYVKIVVTADEGRYLIRELPEANYTLRDHGFGLVDSPKQKAGPGSQGMPEFRSHHWHHHKNGKGIKSQQYTRL